MLSLTTVTRVWHILNLQIEEIALQIRTANENILVKQLQRAEKRNGRWVGD
jgi:hypothetical protein